VNANLDPEGLRTGVLGPIASCTATEHCIPDHLSPSGEEYGRSRLSEGIKSSCNLTAQEGVDSIFSNLDRFNREPFDDQTLVVMKVK